MNLREPIPILEKWSRSRLGRWTAKYARPNALYPPWPLAVFGLLPASLVVLYVDNVFWGTILAIFILLFLIVLTILIYAAQGSTVSQPDAEPLTTQKKQDIINSMKDG